MEAFYSKLFRVRYKDIIAITIIAIFCVSYILIMSYLSIMKYLSFNADYLDLGLNNHVLWLLTHGGISLYYKSNFYLVYPLQYEKPITFLFALIYFLDPHIEFLLVIQSLFLGLTPFPLYIIAKKMTENRIFSLIISISALWYFPLWSANLFDFHFLSLFPLFYLCMVMYWSLGRKKLMYTFALLSSSVNPIIMIMVIFFLCNTLIFNKSDEKFNFKKIILDNYLTIFVISFLVCILVLYHFESTLYTAGAFNNNDGYVQLISYNLSGKFTLFLFLFAALGFLPLLDIKSLIPLIPYIGYVLLSTDPANTTIFGLHYTILAFPVLYTALIMSFYKVKKLVQKNYIPRGSEYNNCIYTEKNNTKQFSIENKLIRFVLIFIILFSVMYYPLSPLNQYVSGGPPNGNFELKTITTITPQMIFLDNVINLIPNNGSVLTQNSIPQLSGREYVQVPVLPSVYIPSIPYNYILIDTAITPQIYLTQFISIINHSLDNHTFGILAEGMGAILLERGYTGLPILFAPLDFSIGITSFYIPNNSELVNNSTILGLKGGQSMWFGPYINLPPGKYSVTYYISSSNASKSTQNAISIDTVYGNTILASQNISINQFQDNNSIKSFTLFFQLNDYEGNIQFRGMNYNGNSDLTFYGVTILQKK